MPEHIDQQPATHTAGPWTIAFRGTSGNAYIHARDHSANAVAVVRLRSSVTNNITERDANATLIALAPRMAEALKSARDAWHADGWNFTRKEPAWLPEVRAILAELEG